MEECGMEDWEWSMEECGMEDWEWSNVEWRMWNGRMGME